jgi:hypothetical protein
LLISASLNDSDSVTGIQMIRQSNGIISTPGNRIIHMELEDNWLGALREYDLLKSLLNDRQVPESNMMNGIYQNTLSESYAEDDSYSSIPNASQSLYQPNISGNHFAPDIKSLLVAQIERGRMTCLIQMEHLNLAIDEVRENYKV